MNKIIYIFSAIALLICLAVLFTDPQPHLLIYSVGGIAVWLLLRPVMHWYYGINELKEEIQELRELVAEQREQV